MSAKRAILVLGMHRSGTSVLTRILNLLGASVANCLMTPTEENPSGYWESVRIAKFNNQLLESAKTSWKNDSPIPDEWFESPEREQDLIEAKKILEEEYGQEEIIVIKCPRLCLLLPFWKKVLRDLEIDAYAILLLRDPLEVAISLAARALFPEMSSASISNYDTTAILWLRYVLDAERNTRDIPRFAIDYSDLIANWETTLNPVFEGFIPFFPTNSPIPFQQIESLLHTKNRRKKNALDFENSGDEQHQKLETLRRLKDTIIRNDEWSTVISESVYKEFERLRKAYAPFRTGSNFSTTEDIWAGVILNSLNQCCVTNQNIHIFKQKVLFISNVESNNIGQVFRVRNIVSALESQGWLTAYYRSDNPEVFGLLNDFNLVVVFRTEWDSNMNEIKNICLAKKIKLIFDIDDLIFDPDFMNPKYFAYLDSQPDYKRIEWTRLAYGQKTMLENSDFAILTTRPLANYAARYCPKTFVLPNMLNHSMAEFAEIANKKPKPSLSDGIVRIGFASGTNTHQRDFEAILPALISVLSKHLEVQLIIVGVLDIDNYKDLLPLRHRIEIRPKVPLNQLWDEIVRFDINLSPLEVGNPFCESKSELRYVLASSVSIPTIASPTIPFKQAIIEGSTGYLCDTIIQWEQKLTLLINNKTLRENIGKAAKEHVIAQFGPEAMASKANVVYSQLLLDSKIKQNTDLPKIILILGMHRSGTSLIAQLVAKWGAYMVNDLMPASFYNQDGYWEYNPLVDFHEKLLEKTNNNWYAPSEEINTKELLIEFGDEARQLVKNMDQSDVWCWKDPRMPLFLDFWKEILAGRDIVYILSNRPLNEIAASLLVRDKIPASMSLSLWEFATSNIFRALSNETTYKFIDYEKLVLQPEIFCKDLFSFLNKSCQLQKSPQIYEAMVQTVKKSLNHAKPVKLTISPSQRKLQQIIENEHIPADFRISEHELLFFKEKFSLYRQFAVNDLTIHFAQLYFKNEINGYDENHSQFAEITGGSQKLIFKFDNPLLVKNLRFDPLNDYVWVCINSIHLVNKGKILDVPLTLSSNAISAENGVYLFDIKDSQIHISHTGNKSAEVSEVIIQLNYLQTGVNAMSAILQHKQQNIIQKQERIAILSELLHTSESQKEALRIDLSEKDEIEKNQQELIKQQSKHIESLNQHIESSKAKLAKEQKVFINLQRSNYENLPQITGQINLIRMNNAELMKVKKSFSFKISRSFSILHLMFQPSRLIRSIRKKAANIKSARLIRQSGLFDSDYYLQNNPDVRDSGMDAVKHFLLYGGVEGRNPSEKFDAVHYLKTYSDVKTAGMNPLYHFIKFGQHEGRQPVKQVSAPNIKNQAKNEVFQEHTLSYPENLIVKNPQKLKSFFLENNGYTEFINKYFDRIYVINLRRRQNKYNEIVQTLKQLNISAEITEAVDGYKSPHLDEYEVYKNTPMNPEYAHPEELKLNDKLIYSPGVWGHLKSNRLILKDALAKGYEKILILEDDVMFMKNFHHEFGKFTGKIDEKNWKFLYLGATQASWDIPGCIIYTDKSIKTYQSGMPLYHPVSTVGSFALAIHRSQFESIINKIDEMNCPFDWIYKLWFNQLSEQCFVAQPNLIIANMADSDNRPKEESNVEKMLAIQRRKWDLSKYD